MLKLDGWFVESWFIIYKMTAADIHYIGFLKSLR